MSRSIEPGTTLGALASRMPECTVVFDLLGLDYACGGPVTLQEACREAGLTLSEVLRRLQSLSAATVPARRWDLVSMTELADHIEATHHFYAREAFAALAEQLPKAAAEEGRHGTDLPRLAWEVESLSFEMREHMDREERVLFPWIRGLEQSCEMRGRPPWSIRRPISCMEHDHDEVASAFGRIRELTRRYVLPAGAPPSVRTAIETLRRLDLDTREHLHKENNILFPGAVAAELRLGLRENAST